MAAVQKLVRDNIPDIISADGQVPITRTLEGEEFQKELLRKLSEEAEEVRTSFSNRAELVKELADVYEVLDATITLFALDGNEIKNMQERRRKERGGFERRIYLESID